MIHYANNKPAQDVTACGIPLADAVITAGAIWKVSCIDCLYGIEQQCNRALFETYLDSGINCLVFCDGDWLAKPYSAPYAELPRIEILPAKCSAFALDASGIKHIGDFDQIGNAQTAIMERLLCWLEARTCEGDKPPRLKTRGAK